MKDVKTKGLMKPLTKVLKALGDIGIELHSKLVNQVHNTGKIPDERRKSVFVMLPKKLVQWNVKITEH